jgi:hypothetical protein
MVMRAVRGQGASDLMTGKASQGKYHGAGEGTLVWILVVSRTIVLPIVKWN